MVSKKRLFYGGFDGFRAPVVPKAPRSIRRNPHKISAEKSEICPFELLAAVAGKLLEESESSTSSTGPERKQKIDITKDSIKQEPLDVKLKPLKLDFLDQGCCAESEFVPENRNPELKIEPQLKDPPHSDNDSGLEHASVVTTSDFLKEIGTQVKLEASGVNGTVEKECEDLTAVKKPVNHGSKSYSSIHVPFYSNPVPSACFPKHRGNVKIGIRDDDENSFSCNHYSSKMRAFRFQSRGGYRRIRKMLNNKYWKAAPKLKDYEISNINSCGVNPFDQSRKRMYKRCQVENSSKRRKLFHHSLKNDDYVQEASSESISNLPERSSPADSNRGVTSSVINHKSSFQSKDGHVKFSIKSFKVPELYVEMPETSTVGSLKRTIMEAVTAILGGELDVGVLLEGKKVSDDNQTLQQTGISINSDTLGFILEPSLPQNSQIQEQHVLPLLPPSETLQPLPRCPATPVLDTGLEKQVEKNEEIKSFANEEMVVDNKALVPVPEALAVVPLNHKQNKKSELSQRRTRRPFSVSEVEALVEAVEKLGTGRWRDVKIRAFDDANHRTYVDLKDKWKTLVHTASISPQQRRGEPVPQDLLDRVLGAHAKWSQKQHGKSEMSPVKVCLELES